MSHPTYKQVRDLAEGFAEGKNIRNRRHDGNELVELLNRADIRKRLLSEANNRPDSLREMWRLLVQLVLKGVGNMHSSGKKTTKVLPEDVRILRKVVEACIKATEGFENELSASKLTKREVRSAIKLVLELLDEIDEEKLEANCELALLELLALICSAREFVVHFRPDNDMRVILEVAERRIEQGKQASIILAAQIFHRLLVTAVSLQMSLDFLMPGCVKVVSSWCRNKHDMSDNILGELEFILGGLAVLLDSSPEQAVGPVTRHGAVILKFCKRRYAKPATRQSSKDRDALNQYFMAHMYV